MQIEKRDVKINQTHLWLLIEPLDITAVLEVFRLKRSNAGQTVVVKSFRRALEQLQVIV